MARDREFPLLSLRPAEPALTKLLSEEEMSLWGYPDLPLLSVVVVVVIIIINYCYDLRAV